MTSDLRIEHFTVQDIHTGLDCLRALQDPHGHLQSYGEAWRSLLISNPLAQAGDPALSLALDGRCVIGHIGHFSAEYLLAGQLRKMFWWQALNVEEPYRASGVGGALLIEANKRAPAFGGSGRPGAMARRIYEALGANYLGTLRRFMAVLTPHAFLSRHVGPPSLVTVAGSLLALPLAAYNLMRWNSLPSSSSLDFRPVLEFEAGIDDLILADPRPQMPRKATTLNWILRHLAHHAFQIYAGNRLVGYALFKLVRVPVVGSLRPTMTSVLYLVDYHLPFEESWMRRELLAFALRSAREKKSDRFETQVLGDELELVCRNAGLVESEGNIAYLKPMAADRSQTESATGWFLTFATGDIVLLSGNTRSS